VTLDWTFVEFPSKSTTQGLTIHVFHPCKNVVSLPIAVSTKYNLNPNDNYGAAKLVVPGIDDVVLRSKHEIFVGDPAVTEALRTVLTVSELVNSSHYLE